MKKIISDVHEMRWFKMCKASLLQFDSLRKIAEHKKKQLSESQSNINYDSIGNCRPLTRLIAIALPYA